MRGDWQKEAQSALAVGEFAVSVCARTVWMWPPRGGVEGGVMWGCSWLGCRWRAGSILVEAEGGVAGPVKAGRVGDAVRGAAGVWGRRWSR